MPAGALEQGFRFMAGDFPVEVREVQAMGDGGRGHQA
jgi:hypothetical protein